MLKSRYARRLARLEARYGVGPMNGEEAVLKIIVVKTPKGPGRPEDGAGRAQEGRPQSDKGQDLAAEVEVLERRRQELEAEIGEAAT
ncbi:MAG: hypothetical protein ABFD52_04865 [Acidobacteriota bacterium]